MEDRGEGDSKSIRRMKIEGRWWWRWGAGGRPRRRVDGGDGRQDRRSQHWPARLHHILLRAAAINHSLADVSTVIVCREGQIVLEQHHRSARSAVRASPPDEPVPSLLAFAAIKLRNLAEFGGIRWNSVEGEVFLVYAVLRRLCWLTRGRS